MTEIQRLEEEVKRLWSLLDDISTAGDMFKPEIGGYFRYVDRKCEERNGIVTSDGYTLTIAPASKPGLVYGFCPKCGANGVSRERRPNGNDRCERGCEYPSKDAEIATFVDLFIIGNGETLIDVRKTSDGRSAVYWWLDNKWVHKGWLMPALGEIKL